MASSRRVVTPRSHGSRALGSKDSPTGRSVPGCRVTQMKRSRVARHPKRGTLAPPVTEATTNPKSTAKEHSAGPHKRQFGMHLSGACDSGSWPRN